MSQPSAISYEDIPYHEHVYVHTHPDRAATFATLQGMPAVPAGTARVLELGSGMGTNLVAIAQSLPGSHCLGIDRSPRQTAAAQTLAQTLGQKNVEFRAADLMDLDDSLGSFDYILCHGLYSWVPPPVRDRLLALCARHLAPHGVAYISYNTYPGWHFRRLIREMMLFHANPFPDPAQRVRQARALLTFLNDTAGGSETIFGQVLRVHYNYLKDRSDSYVAHEFLAGINEPVYFHQFMEHATAHGLQYLGEAQLTALPAGVTPQARKTLEQLPDLIHVEQYLDFIRNRTFRRTLLCHAGVRLERRSTPDQLMGLKASAAIRPPAARPDVASAEIEEFHAEEGIHLSTGAPLVKALLTVLADAAPRALSLEELADGVQQRLNSTAPVAGLTESVMQCYFTGLLDLHREVPALTAEVSERPVGSPLARVLAVKDQPLPNVWHRSVLVSPIHRQVLRLLDGSRAAGDIVEALCELVRTGDFALQKDDQPVREPDLVRQAARASLASLLRDLADSGLLIA
jgi:methyltransferase-like protein/2-polyprenyl-3-methyl-5-hydroxy-6-metoxy-1,4-benzoquinol methylase